MPPKRVREESEPGFRDESEPEFNEESYLSLLADAALHQGKVEEAKRTMHLIALSSNTRCNSNEQQVVLDNIVIQHQDGKIYAHDITDPTVTYEMDQPPLFWIRRLKTIFAPKKQPCEPAPKPVPEPVPEHVPIIRPSIDKEQTFQTLMSLLAKLPPCNKLVIVRLEDGKIILQVLGKLLDAVITIENGMYYECCTETKVGDPKLRVPWVPPKPNASLGTQMVMLAKDAPKWFVEIHVQLWRMIGIHRYDCGGIVCLTTPNGVNKFSFNTNQHPSLDGKNKKLVVIKTPGAPFDGVIKTIKKKVVDGYELIDGSLLPLSGVEPLDKVMAAFKQTGRLH
jgi:hypothetical protein